VEEKEADMDPEALAADDKLKKNMKKKCSTYFTLRFGRETVRSRAGYKY
jgi:hypothetical protein